ncbi:MAG TPA: hypothetical protein VHQ99_03765 [Gaiellaceae bacterium]|nr:hypothetical protein [Gaiellaceae bacterium]
MTRSRLFYLLLIASLFAYFLACFRFSGFSPLGMSDGGGLL